MQIFNGQQKESNMRKHAAIRVLISALITLSYGFVTSAVRINAQAVVEGKYASVNGLKLYYEVHGTGQPLVLLHGGLGGIVEYAQLLPALAKNRQVIAVEMQGHGHTA